MQHTDPASAAYAYRQALEAVMQAKSLSAAQLHARRALAIQQAEALDSTITITNGFGARTNQPFITLAMSTPVVQLDADHAREIAMQIIESVEAARMDGFLIRFVREEMHDSDATAAMLLDLFRHYRSGGRIDESEEQ